MLLRIRDKAADITHKSIVLDVSIHSDYIVKTLILHAPKTQKRHMLAHVPSLAVAEEGFSSGRRCRVILRVVFPVEQISDRSMLAIVIERPLVVTKELWFVGSEITARDHRQVVWIRIVVEGGGGAEDCALLGQAFQKVVLDGGLIVLIFEYDDEHVVEMLWRRRGSGPRGRVLCKAENREGPTD